MLSARQEQVLKFIHSHTEQYRIAPSMRQIQEHLGVNSSSMVQSIIKRLIQYGFIQKTSHSWRSIKLIEPITPYSLPLVGKIAAGSPIEAIETPESIAVAKLLTGENRFLLEVKGNSMAGDNICDGDWIICEKACSADNGKIVVALIDNYSATLKRFYHKKDHVVLEASNKNYPSQQYNPDRITIQGIYLGLIRFNKH